MFCSACGSALPHTPPVRCTACEADHWENAKPCAGALVTRAGQLVLVRRTQAPWRGRWDVPGGFCEPGEHPIATAEREAREETGLAVRVTGFLGMWLDDYAEPAEGGRRTRTLNIYYHAAPLEAEGSAAPDPAEVAELAWFGPDELPDAIAFPGHVAAVLRAWREALAAGVLAGPLPDHPAYLPSL